GDAPASGAHCTRVRAPFVRPRVRRTRFMRMRFMRARFRRARFWRTRFWRTRFWRTRFWRTTSRLICAAIAVLAVLSLALPAAAEPKIKIGVIFDLTGPLAGGGSELHYLGAKIMIDHFIKQGGVEGYQIEAVYADAQSKPDVAINEAVRLIEQENVDMVLGFFSSAQCVPVAARVEQLKKFMWITTCISSAVLENRNLKYVFRAQPSGAQ